MFVKPIGKYVARCFLQNQWFVAIAILLGACEKTPQFVEQVPHPVLVSKTITIQEFVRNQADIIWVIDNSSSMNEEQEALIENMDYFINAFTSQAQGAQAHWRMALLSTDESESPYVGFEPWDYLDHNHPDPVGRFNAAIAKLGTSGNSSAEQAFNPLRWSLAIYGDFLRENSKLFIIIVSDEDEQSHNVSVDHFIEFLHSLKNPDSIFTYGVFPLENRNCGISMDYSNSRYREFMKKTNGLVFPCVWEIMAKDCHYSVRTLPKKYPFPKLNWIRLR